MVYTRPWHGWIRTHGYTPQSKNNTLWSIETRDHAHMRGTSHDRMTDTFRAVKLVKHQAHKPLKARPNHTARLQRTI